MGYIVSQGPYSELDRIEGTEMPVWFITEYDQHDNELNCWKFYSLYECLKEAEKMAIKNKTEHVCEAGQA